MGLPPALILTRDGRRIPYPMTAIAMVYVVLRSVIAADGDDAAAKQGSINESMRSQEVDNQQKIFRARFKGRDIRLCADWPCLHPSVVAVLRVSSKRSNVRSCENAKLRRCTLAEAHYLFPWWVQH